MVNDPGQELRQNRRVRQRPDFRHRGAHLLQGTRSWHQGLRTSPTCCAHLDPLEIDDLRSEAPPTSMASPVSSAHVRRSLASLESPRCRCCCSCCGCCRCRQVQDDMQGIVIALSSLSFSSLGLFGLTLGFSDSVSVASLFGRFPGCSPDSAPSFGAAHAGSIVNSDPPRSFPPLHVSVRDIVVFIRLVRILFLSSLFNAFLSRCLLSRSS